MNIVMIGGVAAVFSWSDGFSVRQEEPLLAQARKSDDDLLRVCLWLEHHGREEEAIALLEGELA